MADAARAASILPSPCQWTSRGSVTSQTHHPSETRHGRAPPVSTQIDSNVKGEADSLPAAAEGWGEKVSGRWVGRHPVRPLLAPSWRYLQRGERPVDRTLRRAEPAPVGRVLLETRHSRFGGARTHRSLLLPDHDLRDRDRVRRSEAVPAHRLSLTAASAPADPSYQSGNLHARRRVFSILFFDSVL
jgi:hypothetical protein